ncbi:hypothetical protein PG997_014091 [Apiospora hydei]|uniref:DUF6546 domain-containing protein n=1 Tax=Apiospora hydei TaxID=1337664 RepID=A0ABR1V811_9PEZI
MVRQKFDNTFRCYGKFKKSLRAFRIHSTEKSEITWQETMAIEWDDLPKEIRLLILEALIQDGCSLGPLATVSREWQTKIEQHNFARIKVTRTRLPDLNWMTHRNRALIRYIWFCLELEDYDCTGCKSYMPSFNGELVKSHDRDSDYHNTVTGALNYLFWLLSADSDHWFKYLTFMPDMPSDRLVGDSIEEVISNRTYHDPQHDWVSGVRRYAPPEKAFRRVFRTIKPFWAQLPPVPAVTSLLLRQQTRRAWTQQSLVQMFSCFPRLQEIHYEPWRLNMDLEGGFYDAGERTAEQLPTLLFTLNFRYTFDSLKSSNNNLKRLVVFENFNQHYPHPGEYNTPRNPHPSSSGALAMVSRRLEHLAASFVVEASHFFDLYSPRATWPMLTSLVLTSNLLTPVTRPAKIAAMLEDATATAMRMPKLETLEIWNGRKGLAALFQYQASRNIRPATITWRGTWELAMEPAVIQAWEAVARRHGGWRLDLVRERLEGADIMSHGDAIHHLKLAGQVIRPISLLQIRAEHEVLEGFSAADYS